MIERPWAGFDDVDQAARSRDYIEYLDRIRELGDTMDYKQRSFELLDLDPGSRVLDVGCGTGEDSLAISRMIGKNGIVDGVDPSRTMIEEARRRAQASGLRVAFRVGDAHALDFDDETFDAARADRHFLFLEDPAKAVAEMVRVLKPGGVIYVRDPDMQTMLLDHPDRDRTRAIADAFSDSFGNGWSGRGLYRLLHDAGLRDIAYEPRTLVLHDFEEADTMFAIGRAVAFAVDRGLVSAQDGAGWLDDLRFADRRGDFVFSLTFFEAHGRRWT